MKYTSIERSSPQSQAVRENTRGFRASCERPDAVSVQDRRQAIAGMMREGYSQHVRRESDVFGSVDMDGVSAEVVSISGTKPDCNLLFLHGGAYFLGNPQTARTLTVPLARLANAKVFVPDYRLAPEHKFPAAADDAWAAYRYLIEVEGVDPASLFVGGDSCGVNLAFGALLRARQAGLPTPRGVVAFSPWLDLTSSLPSFRTNAQLDEFVHVNIVDTWVAQYMGEQSWGHPLASPLGADLRGMPACFIACGSTEMWHDDAAVLAHRLDKLGVDVELEVWKDLPHVWPIFAGQLPEADEALSNAAQFMRRCLR
ncbi:alpha/beta hydrolase [Variovorax sp. E3]|uniref:alpha/beta hydrolase n=1 Tax=Variovorax sp. E3 TaxID=1914993 RepID=UPI0018DECE29|nr:alpha/beta hydrolase [Variovorax sp. E3]